MTNVFRLLGAAIVASFLFAGCYESTTLLLDTTDARQPITTYDDWHYTRDGTTNHARLNPRSDGWYDYETAVVHDDGTEGEWVGYTVLLNYLMTKGGVDVYVTAHWDEDEQAYIYSLVGFERGGAWQSFMPECDEFTGNPYAPGDVEAATSAGAELYEFEFVFVCLFTTRQSLFDAMRMVVQNQNFSDRLKEAKK